MSMRMSKGLWSVGAAATLAACITVNIYFPAPEVRRAAEEIVEETWGDAASARPTPGSEPAATQSSWLDLLAPAPAAAQQADINVSTAAIRALKESMRQRAGQLKPYLSAGQVGIGNDGLLVVRNLAALPLNTQATVRRLVEAENADRRSLYREIAKANKFGDERIPDIQKIFAETWVQKAEPGWWIQNANGQWTQK
jgi:uncharacterized protein YdbL (DUF1318 family)